MLPAVLVPRGGHSPAREPGSEQGCPQGRHLLCLPAAGRAVGGGMWMCPGVWGSPQHPPSHPVTPHVPFTQLSPATFSGIHPCVPGMGPLSGVSLEKGAPPAVLPVCVTFPEDPGSWLSPCPLSWARSISLPVCRGSTGSAMPAALVCSILELLLEQERYGEGGSLWTMLN